MLVYLHMYVRMYVLAYLSCVLCSSATDGLLCSTFTALHVWCGPSLQGVGFPSCGLHHVGGCLRLYICQHIGSESPSSVVGGRCILTSVSVDTKRLAVDYPTHVTVPSTWHVLWWCEVCKCVCMHLTALCVNCEAIQHVMSTVAV